MADVTTQTAPVVWVDLGTSDLDDAVRFYEALLGWRTERSGADGWSYVVAHNDRGEVGGMMALDPAAQAAGAPSAWTVVLGSDDLDRSVARVRVLGGSVLEEPSAIPGGARIAVVADPAGAVFALLEAPGDGGPALTRQGTGCVAWVECLSRDPVVSRRFIEALFGWTAQGDTGGYVMFAAGGEPVAGLMAMPSTVPAEAPSCWLVYFAVDDVVAACERAVAAGGQVTEPVHDIPEGRFAVVADPEGAIMAVFERTPA